MWRNLYAMGVQERTQDLRMVAELLRVHLPDQMADDKLCKDICAVMAINLRRVASDSEQSANAWDKKTYHSKADELRREHAWVASAAQVAEALAYSAKKFDFADLARLRGLVPLARIEMLERPRFKDVSTLRGAAQAARSTLLKPR